MSLTAGTRVILSMYNHVPISSSLFGILLFFLMIWFNKIIDIIGRKVCILTKHHTRRSSIMLKIAVFESSAWCSLRFSAIPAGIRWCFLESFVRYVYRILFIVVFAPKNASFFYYYFYRWRFVWQKVIFAPRTYKYMVWRAWRKSRRNQRSSSCIYIRFIWQKKGKSKLSIRERALRRKRISRSKRYYFASHVSAALTIL